MMLAPRRCEQPQRSLNVIQNKKRKKVRNLGRKKKGLRNKIFAARGGEFKRSSDRTEKPDEESFFRTVV